MTSDKLKALVGKDLLDVQFADRTPDGQIGHSPGAHMKLVALMGGLSHGKEALALIQGRRLRIDHARQLCLPGGEAPRRGIGFGCPEYDGHARGKEEINLPYQRVHVSQAPTVLANKDRKIRADAQTIRHVVGLAVVVRNVRVQGPERVL
jgi:hypothetical protein